MLPAAKSGDEVSSTLEEAIGYQFRNRGYLVRALTHRSRSAELANPDQDSNERLEFLGDAILGFVASEALVERNPSAREGYLSALKAHLVSSDHLYRCAIDLGLGNALLLGRGEEQNGGRGRKALLADALEAIIAAMYLDGGIEPVKSFIHRHILQLLDSDEGLAAIQASNYKSSVQEKAQALGLPVPTYRVVGSGGPEHARIFTVEGRIGDSYAARGCGTSKKAASQAAAGGLLEQLNSMQQS